jgi:hypothetical protein
VFQCYNPTFKSNLNKNNYPFAKKYHMSPHGIRSIYIRVESCLGEPRGAVLCRGQCCVEDVVEEIRPILLCPHPRLSISLIIKAKLRNGDKGWRKKTYYEGEVSCLDCRKPVPKPLPYIMDSFWGPPLVEISVRLNRLKNDYASYTTIL